MSQTESDLRTILAPSSIAVIGASRKPGTVGYQIIDNLVRHGYQGVVYPVNPNARFIHSIQAYPSVKGVPGPVELAVVVVPKEYVNAVVEECAEVGVPSVVVISAGFKEVGGAGVALEEELVERVRRNGMRLVGPNCMGVVNTAPDMRMNATFAPSMPPTGPVSFMSQSGAMGVTILDYAAEYGIGVHNFVSVGNKPDVSGNDLIEYWADDDQTRVILMYLENFGNPQKYLALAREVTKKKPIVVAKAGRTGAGARAASSHTGALASGSDAATDALLAQSGSIRVDSVNELFDMAMAFSMLPIPEANRVAIITNAGGPGIMIADACESNGLEIVPLADATQEKLRGVLAEEASVRNPVDMIASATPDSYRLVLGHVLADPNVDAAIAAFVPPLGVRQQDVAEAIVDAKAASPDKPVLAVLMGREGLPQGRAELNEAGIPAYIFPESAARALAAMYRYGEWQKRPVGVVRTFEDVDQDAAAAILDAAEPGYLTPEDAAAVLRAYGIPIVGSRVAASAAEAHDAAEALGYPVVLKILSPDVVHKSDVGGIALDLRTADDVDAAYRDLMNRVSEAAPDAAIDGVLVQSFVRKGQETIIGMSKDPSYGPVLMFGLGGIYVEALQDVVFRIHPVTDVDTAEMVRSIRGREILEGIRGQPPADREAIQEVIQRVSQLVGEHPEIAELDMNPVVVHERGAVAVDARMRIHDRD